MNYICKLHWNPTHYEDCDCDTIALNETQKALCNEQNIMTTLIFYPTESIYSFPYTMNAIAYLKNALYGTSYADNYMNTGNFLLIYICNFHVLSNLLLIYICKLHWNILHELRCISHILLEINQLAAEANPVLLNNIATYSSSRLNVDSAKPSIGSVTADEISAAYYTLCVSDLSCTMITFQVINMYFLNMLINKKNNKKETPQRDLFCSDTICLH